MLSARSALFACVTAALALSCAHSQGPSAARDRDGDGIADARDSCPALAEDKDGFEDGDGCPDADDDRDGVPDARDLCPRDAEDKDGFEDGDGCPEVDNDKDRIADKSDACPNHPETYNGFEDGDGCPEPLPYDSARHGSFTDALFVVRPVFFEKGSARLRADDSGYLAKFSAWLASEPAVQLVAVIGHASKDEPQPMNIAHQRARAVAKVLGAKIGRARVRVHSAGTTPAAEWAKVRRPTWKDRSVHFRYFRVAGKDVYRWDGQRDVPVERGHSQ